VSSRQCTAPSQQLNIAARGGKPTCARTAASLVQGRYREGTGKVQGRYREGTAASLVHAVEIEHHSGDALPARGRVVVRGVEVAAVRTAARAALVPLHLQRLEELERQLRLGRDALLRVREWRVRECCVWSVACCRKECCVWSVACTATAVALRISSSPRR
jgi:hypothetical protein